jgi:hypothetical protein
MLEVFKTKCSTSRPGVRWIVPRSMHGAVSAIPQLTLCPTVTKPTHLLVHSLKLGVMLTADNATMTKKDEAATS